MPRRAIPKRYVSPPPFVPDGGRYYSPTPSINPPRPRTLEASYYAPDQTLRIRFRNGVVYGYYDVPPQIWRNLRRVKSPGRFINRRLNAFQYGPEEIGEEFGPMPPTEEEALKETARGGYRGPEQNYEQLRLPLEE